MLTLLRQPGGITAEEISEALGWQLHTTRGAIAGLVKKRLGLEVETERVEIAQPDGKTKRTTRYRVVEASTAATEG